MANDVTYRQSLISVVSLVRTTREKVSALVDIARAARAKKNAPLLFLLVGGALTAGSQPKPWLIAVSLLTLVFSSAFMTHVNILTDAKLDREKKPHLLRWLAADPFMMKVALSVELLCVLAGLYTLAQSGEIHAAFGLFIFTVLTTLYSYNFLAPWDAAACRLKVYWWGHFLVCQGGYMALWYAGYFCAKDSSWATFTDWLPIFFFASLSEYALFLSESALDAKEERAFGLKTCAALLGTERSSLLALLVWLTSFAGIAAYGLISPLDDLRRLILIAFIPSILLRGGAAALLSARRSQRRDDAIRSSLPDMVFIGGRMLTVLSLALLWAQFHH